jgi:hypothetical protein
MDRRSLRSGRPATLRRTPKTLRRSPSNGPVSRRASEPVPNDPRPSAEGYPFFTFARLGPRSPTQGLEIYLFRLTAPDSYRCSVKPKMSAARDERVKATGIVEGRHDGQRSYCRYSPSREIPPFSPSLIINSRSSNALFSILNR